MPPYLCQIERTAAEVYQTRIIRQDCIAEEYLFLLFYLFSANSLAVLYIDFYALANFLYASFSRIATHTYISAAKTHSTTVLVITRSSLNT